MFRMKTSVTTCITLKPLLGRLLVEMGPVGDPDRFAPRQAFQKRDRRVREIVQRQQQRGGEMPASMKVAALMMGACEKGLQAAYERNHHPPEKLHQPWIDDCIAQMTNALSTIDAMIEQGSPHVLLQRLTQADVTAFVAERLARGLGVDTSARTPRLHDLAMRLADEHPFRSTEP